MSDTSPLYPRLLTAEAGRLADRLQGVGIKEARRASQTHHDAAIFTATGGTRAGREKLKYLQQAVRTEVENFGYPDPAPRSARNDSDAAVAECLHREMAILPAEAGKDGVWTFLTCVLLPDVVRWRFPGKEDVTTRNRFTSGRRNTFGRLWWRAEVMERDGDYQLLQELNEDEKVQLFERSGLYGYPELTRTMAKRFLALDRHLDLSNRRDLLRDAQKRITRFSSFVSLGSLEDAALTALVDEALLKGGQAKHLFEEWPVGLQTSGEEMRRRGRRGRTSDQATEEPSAQREEGQSEDPDPDGQERDELAVKILDMLPVDGDGLSAAELAERITSSEDRRSPVKSEINNRLYSVLSDLVESEGERPPRWRLLQPAEGEETDRKTREGPTEAGSREHIEVACSTNTDGTGFGIHLSFPDHWPENFPAKPDEAVELVSLVTRHQYPFIVTGEPKQLRPLAEEEIADRINQGVSAVEQTADRIRLQCDGREHNLKELIPGSSKEEA